MHSKVDQESAQLGNKKVGSRLGLMIRRLFGRLFAAVSRAHSMTCSKSSHEHDRDTCIPCTSIPEFHGL